MTLLVFATLGSAVLGWLMFLLSVFLILLILVQRGKGGGLTGALGGPGGQSAFGSKAGDTFTLITAVSAIIWGLVCGIAMYSLGVPPMTAAEVDFQADEPPPTVESLPGEDSQMSGLSGLLSDDLDAEGDESAVESDNADQGTTGTPSAELTPAEPAETTDESATEDSASDEEMSLEPAQSSETETDQPVASDEPAATDADSDASESDPSNADTDTDQ
ncbi:preprotein translocase subunit SecG [Roseiconus nitratireducens]|uniref:Protein-export membrane protein SecG n=1 Tax=Roseiconus nitratireducens TaxID=2605748 RepID=A0A5M6D918_9BACT|nr:preprotein translocase subunit SecG [Roseiconus nitratireducens]KAA5543853.1 preprotein translocase subunit SecG [Roseiconus nitratireducens]